MTSKHSRAKYSSPEDDRDRRKQSSRSRKRRNSSSSSSSESESKSSEESAKSPRRWPHDRFEDNNRRRRSRSPDQRDRFPNHGGGRFTASRDERKQHEDLMKRRRRQRVEIGEIGVRSLWNSSPRPDDIDTLDATDSLELPTKRRESGKRKHKKHSEKSKDKKKKKKRKRESSDEEETSADGEPEWLEVTKETLAKPALVDDDEDVNFIGPSLKQSEAYKNEQEEARVDYGRNLLPGEGAAMAAYIAEGKRIPRRGEIGLTSDQIKTYEEAGFVMSGSRHRRMEATRLRKENQIYSAEEKRMLSMFNKEERSKKEGMILSQFRQLVNEKMNPSSSS